MQCATEGCKSKIVFGYDIERVYDRDNCPIYAVYYRCDRGHKFVCEFDRPSPLTPDPNDVTVSA